ncbi:DUF2075 domain-containing protein [Leptospira levettii]|uniref:nuclease-related domain-containing DEAD/DEAH box helicase n=1 Tax=Leptospira levettii TaxID=2023178 RepID=UPI001091E411|nr:NERD domain-containing protein [Leptospira levettii]TGM78604.1 DUF2075 domain-containing protein [Leptospira levettii]
MPEFYPEKFPEEKKNDPRYQAEYKVYDSLKTTLSGDWYVFYNVNWVGKRRSDGTIDDGEIDFVLAHPDKGVLVVEVKGGGIEYDAKLSRWSSIDRNKVKHDIKDPFEQAKANKYFIITKLKEANFLKDKKILIGTCVVFPSISSIPNYMGASFPSQAVVLNGDLNSIDTKILNILEYWKADSSIVAKPERDVIQRLVSVFGKSFSLKPTLGSYISEVNDKIVQLTEEQYRLLDNLDRTAKVAISGGAGTGKTMLAVEKAVRLANEGIQTLFVCYNSNLADYVQDSVGNLPNLTIKTFHSLCQFFDKMASIENPGVRLDYNKKDQNYFDNILPDRLMSALEKVSLRFNAILVDEGQDFQKHWWIPLEELLGNKETGIFYIFYDERQRLYDTEQHFPFAGKMLPFTLNTNLRNTKSIFEYAKKYEKVPSMPHAFALEGEPVDFIDCKDKLFLRSELARKLQKFIINEKVPKGKIAILSVNGINQSSDLGETDAIAAFSTTNNLSEWGNKIFYDTVRKFKGLEADVIFLIDVDFSKLNDLFQNELLYVAITRAKAKLIVMGENVSKYAMQI